MSKCNRENKAVKRENPDGRVLYRCSEQLTLITGCLSKTFRVSRVRICRKASQEEALVRALRWQHTCWIHRPEDQCSGAKWTWVVGTDREIKARNNCPSVYTGPSVLQYWCKQNGELVAVLSKEGTVSFLKSSQLLNRKHTSTPLSSISTSIANIFPSLLLVLWLHADFYY
jgi:hypothetical protein